jgi:hypothetical protein
MQFALNLPNWSCKVAMEKHMQTKAKQSGFLIMLFAAIFLLSACGGRVDQTVTLLRNGQWQTELTVTIPTEVLVMLGPSNGMEADIDSFIEQLEEEGATASWKSSTDDTYTIYTIQAQGDELDVLQNTVFDGDLFFTVDEVNGREQVNVRGRWLAAGDAEMAVLTIEGRNVVTSNSGTQDGGAVTWTNPGLIEASFLPKGGGRAGLWITLVALAAAAGGGYYLYNERQAKPAMKQCANCGTMATNPQARFCPSCGKLL